jgi:hypothetical protein
MYLDSIMMGDLPGLELMSFHITLERLTSYILQKRQ